MESNAPRLSIVIPAYNVADFIEPAVASALDQSFRDLEVVVVDDGSTDDTPDRLRAMAENRRDNRHKIIRQANGGLSAARNRGIVEAQGDYIGFLDGDDLWHPDKAAAQLALMEADRSIGISYSASLFLQEDGTETSRRQQPDSLRPSLHDMILRNHVGNGSTPIVARACFEIAGLFREDLRSCEDYEMWCRILWQTDRIAVGLPEPLTYYRLRRSSLSFNVDRFVAEADLAMEIIQSSMREVPRRVIARARAEHYRIAANKAVIAGKRDTARRLLRQVFALRPTIFLTDLRAAATLGILLLPEQGMRKLEQLVLSRRSRRA